MSMISKATKYAKVAHKGQMRKMSKTPYVSHVINVGKILKRYSYRDEVIVAGILHDTIEDTKTTYDNIVDEFSKDVADLVDSASESDKSQSWEARKKHTIEAIKSASKESMAIIGADKLDNLESTLADLNRMGDKVWAKFNAPKERQAWYYGSILEVLESKLGKSGLVKDLRIVYDKIFNDVTKESFKAHYYK